MSQNDNCSGSDEKALIAATKAVEAMQKEHKELEGHYSEGATKTAIDTQLVGKPGEAAFR